MSYKLNEILEKPGYLEKYRESAIFNRSISMLCLYEELDVPALLFDLANIIDSQTKTINEMVPYMPPTRMLISKPGDVLLPLNPKFKENES